MMKLKLNFLFAFIAVISLFTSCDKREYDTPPLNIPVYEGEATHTIEQFKQTYTDELVAIDEDVIITGVITANDESGNLYKKMVIEDGSAAIELSIDRNSLYAEYYVGQQVFVECKGLYTGKYGGLQQIGYKYQNTSGADQIGRMPKELAETHIFSHGNPGEEPKSDTVTIAALDESMMSKLVTFKKVRFANGGKDTYADKDGEYPTSQQIIDENGKSIIAYTSQYAKFASETLPEGQGNVTGIASFHKGTWQLLIRDTTDVENFEPIPEEPIEPADPVTQINEDFESGEDYGTAAINGWISINLQGSDRNWIVKTYNNNNYAQASAHKGSAEDYENWLITPPIDMDNATNKIMSFETAKAYWKSTSSLEVYILDSYELETANKVKLDVVLAKESDADFTFISSGDVDLSAQTGMKYIGFRYVAKGGESNSTTFQLDNFKFGVESDNGGGEVTPVTEINEDFTSGENYGTAAINGWSVMDFNGTDRSWIVKEYSGNKYAQASAHKGSAEDYENWLLTPPVDFDNVASKVMSFETAKAYWKSTSSLEVYVLDGNNPSTANKQKLDVTLAQESDGDFTFISTGDVDLSAQTGIKYIGFRYVAKGGESNSTTFQLDNFKLGVTTDNGGGDNGGGDNGGSTGSEILFEDFADCTGDALNPTTAWGGSSNFPTVNAKVYASAGSVKIGSSSAAGTLESKALDLSANGGAFTVSFKVKGWTADYDNKVVVAVTGMDDKTIDFTSTGKEGEFVTVSANFTGGQANSTITITNALKTGGSYDGKPMRVFIDDVKVTETK